MSNPVLSKDIGGAAGLPAGNDAAVVRTSGGGYEMAALVGGDTVILGWDIDRHADRSDLLGFGIRRTCSDPARPDDARVCWLSHGSRFRHGSEPSDGGTYSSRTEPLQGFWYCDASVEAGLDYTYTLMPVRGTPALRQVEQALTLAVRPCAADADAAKPTMSACTLPLSTAQIVGARAVSALVLELLERAKSAVFVVSPKPLTDAVTQRINALDPGTIVYGIAPRAAPPRPGLRRSNTMQLLDPVLDTAAAGCPFRGVQGEFEFACSSAVVVDPWGDDPQALFWSHAARNGFVRHAPDALLVDGDRAVAAVAASSILKRFRRLKEAEARTWPLPPRRILEQDGRWSGIYFSRFAPQNRYREREVFAGRP